MLSVMLNYGKFVGFKIRKIFTQALFLLQIAKLKCEPLSWFGHEIDGSHATGL